MLPLGPCLVLLADGDESVIFLEFGVKVDPFPFSCRDGSDNVGER